METWTAFETGTHMRQKLSPSMEHHFVVAEGVMGYFDGLGGVSVQGAPLRLEGFSVCRRFWWWMEEEPAYL